MQLDLISVNTRPAKRGDIPYINDLFYKLMNPHAVRTWAHQHELQAFYKKNALNHKDVTILHQDGNDIGFVRIENRDDEVFLDQLHIDAPYQGQGIGSEIVCLAQAFAETQGKCLRLIALRVNPAHRLYQRLGFEIVNEDNARFYMQWDA